MVQGLDSQSIFQIHKQNFFNMSKLPNCERDSLKSFINIFRTYEFDHLKESNIGLVEGFRSKIKILAYQLKQGGYLRIVKKEHMNSR